MILIVTAGEDLHALSILDCIRRMGFPECYIVEADRIAQHETISFSLGYPDPHDWIETHDGTKVTLSKTKVIWLRRFRARQRLRYPLTNEEGAEIVHNDCRGSLTGLLATKFFGKWISNPEASIRASDKIYQLKVAESEGFRIPMTLVSQSFQEIREFFHRCNGQMIVKTVVGVNEPFLKTIKLNRLEDFSAEAFAAAPAIYQEYIEGTQHLRLLCFGNQSLCGLIDTTDIDWRPNLNVAIKEWDVPKSLHQMIRQTLNKLGLEMGVIDLKIDQHGTFVWLEVNPQGQFIFLEPLTGINFIERFSQYLIDQANKCHPSSLTQETIKV